MLFSSGMSPFNFPPFPLAIPDQNYLLMRQPYLPTFPQPKLSPFPQPKLSPAGSEGSSTSRHKSPEASSNSSTSPQSSTKLFRPWLWEPKHEPQNDAAECEKRRGRVSGSRNDRVVPVETTPLLKQQSALEAIATNLGKSGIGHRCIYCGKIYSRKYGLKIHLRTHTGFKPLKCRICDRAFGDPSNLNKHTRLHAENGMGYRCEPCGKVILRRRDLERHLLNRHSTDPEPLPPFIHHHPL